MIGVKRTCCPLCGGKIVVSDHQQFSYDYPVLKSGKLSKRCTRSAIGPMECMTAACTQCGENWDSDSFIIDSDGIFYDYKHTGDNA